MNILASGQGVLPTGYTEYIIPDGFEAQIIDNKVIVKPKKRDDERILEEIADFIRNKVERGSVTEEQMIKSDSWIAYIEKRKAQIKAWVDGDDNALGYIQEAIGYAYDQNFMDAQTFADMRSWLNEKCDYLRGE